MIAPTPRVATARSERGRGVSHRLDQPLDSPDRRERHREAIKDRRRPIADRNEPPGRSSRREQAAAERIDGDQNARRFDGAASMRPCTLGSERSNELERARQHAEASERQRAEDQKRPGGGERTAQSAWSRRLARIPIDKSARDPAKGNRGQRKHDHDRGHADLGEQRPFADRADPVIDQILGYRGIDQGAPVRQRPKVAD